MKLRFATGLAAVTCFFGNPTAALAQTAPWGATLEPNGWLYESASADMAWFSRSAPKPSNSPFRRIWVRQEYASPQDWGVFTSAGYPLKVTSAVGLIEVDCAQLTIRTLQMIYYSEQNMGGQVSERLNKNPPWTYGAPGTLGEAETVTACASASGIGHPRPGSHKR